MYDEAIKARKEKLSPPEISAEMFFTKEQGRAVFEMHVQHDLGMSTEEFLRALDAGEFTGEPENQKVEGLLLLLPLVRKVTWQEPRPTKQ